MRKSFGVAAAVTMALTFASSANASVTVGGILAGSDPYVGPTPTYDFEPGPGTPIVTGGIIDNTSQSGIRAQPLGSEGYYYTVGPSGNGDTPGLIDLTSFGDIFSLSLLWGSVDDYNLLEFLADDGVTVLGSFDGSLFNPANGCQTCTDTNPVITFLLNGGDESTFGYLRLSSEQNAFEIDDIAINPVPEPATWAMMLFGFAAIGMAVRRRRSAIPQLA